MKINFYGYQLGFKGRREDRNAVSQLRKDNDYALTEPNQRRINNAIDKLSNYQGAENLDFILDTAENLQYGTNIDTGKIAKNDWKNRLKQAAESSLAQSDPILQEKYRAKIDKTFNTQKPLTNVEKEIIHHKNSILQQADLNSLKEQKNENIRELERNMDYFVSSSEIPTKQKLYVLKRLDYFMSPDYKITPQLEDKKTQVLAEMMNDLTINTRESKVPNIKAINQKNHGMCAAISITRKAIAYEDKPNYVDSILSELDDTDNVMIYDRFNLGSGKRVPVKKIPIDFNYALSKGYRIVDASATQWMNIADMYGMKNENMQNYNAFDSYYFDAIQDAHFVQNFDDEKLKPKHNYYQILVKAQSDIATLKSDILKRNEENTNRKTDFFKNISESSKNTSLIRNELKKLLPKADKNEINKLTSTLISLQQPLSEKIDKGNPELAAYSFIPNEEESQKIKKITKFLKEQANIPEGKALDNAAQIITDSVIEVNALSEKINPKSTMPDKVKQARKAYEAEAAFRAASIIGLNDPDVYTDKLIKYNIPDRETRISNSLDKLIKLLESGKHPELNEHLAATFQINPENKEEVLNGLKAVKENFNSKITEELDNLYNQLGLGSRIEVLLFEVQGSIQEVKEGKRAEQSRVAEILGIKDDKKTVLQALETFEKQLQKDNVSQTTYVDILNKMGYKDQTDMFVDKFKEVIESTTNENYPNREENIKLFKELHDLPEEATLYDIADIFNHIGDEFNQISHDTDIAAQIITSCENLETAKGSLGSISCNGGNLIIEKMEERGELIPEFIMKKLQDRFVKIDKLRSADEFSSRQGKIAQPELYKFTDKEKNAIKQINKKVNAMYSEVTKSLTNQKREIKPELEELYRYTGTSQGKYWVSGEGHSGLYGPQQVKIFEQITDRPYYEEENIETAVAKILNGTHSGVSSTSVFHDRIGGHAQYVADIRNEGPNQKPALFHDNTWGASEHENTWIDSEGLKRTDYSDRRGGELGYITDDTWKNGNYIDNLIFKKGKISPDSVNSKIYKKINPTGNDEFNFSLINDIIINGDNPKYRSIAASIKDAIYAPNTNWLSSFEKKLATMSKEQIDKAGIGAEGAIKNYKENFNKILKRIEPSPFNPGITSKEDYDKLPDNDMLKIAFEKVAAKQAYPNFYMYEDMGKAKTLEDIQKIKDKLKANAIKDFNYAFAKNEDILLHYAYEHARNMSEKFVEIFQKHNLEIVPDTFSKILHNTAVYEENEKHLFTGRLSDSINFVVNKTLKQFDENMPSNDDTRAAREEIKNVLKSTLENIYYYNEDDLKSDKFRAKSIKKWIDDTFNPLTDEEFVKIYRKLQDMTTEEFNRLTENIPDEALGIKPITGYDVLRKVKASNDKAETDLMNTLFYQEYVNLTDISKTSPNYKYHKTQKSIRGAVYNNGRTFDDIYRSYFLSLQSLEYEKLFNEYKDRNYRKYKAFPSYPKVELVPNMSLETKLKDIGSTLEEQLKVMQLRKKVMNSIKLIDKFEDYVNRIPENRPLSKKEFETIRLMLGEFITDNYSDPDTVNAIEAASKIMELEEGSTVKSIKQFIPQIKEDLKPAVISNKNYPFKEANAENAKNIKDYIEGILLCNIPQQYRRIIREDFKNWISQEYRRSDNTLGKKTTALEMQAKLDEYSITRKSRLKLDKFYNIQKKINIANLVKSSENYDKEEFEQYYQNANKLAEEYVEQFIKPKYKTQALRMMKQWIKNETSSSKIGVFNEEMCDAARTKFAEDFKKYHITKYPLEILKEFMYAAVKDSKTAEFKSYFKKLLSNSLNSSVLIEIQDSLMEAVDAGNAAEVKKHFKDYYVYPYKSEFAQAMDSEESISYMVRSLVDRNNIETAKMFVEKLGLAEKFIDIETKALPNMNIDKRIKKVTSQITATHKNLTAAKQVLNELDKDIDKSDNFEKLIDQAKLTLIKNTKGNKQQSEIKAYLQALDEVKARLIEDPELKRSLILDQYFNDTMQKVTSHANMKSTEEQQYLNCIMKFYSFIELLDLPEYSEAYKKQQQLSKEFNEYRTKYENALIKLQETISGIQFIGI